MFGLDLSEIALIGVVALIFIGPKDMPLAIRTVTGLIKKGRKLAQEFQGHVDDMVRDADLGEARDQFRQLRSMNVRGQIMRALDSDGSVRRALQDDPLRTVPALGAPVARPVEIEGVGETISVAERPRIGVPETGGPETAGTERGDAFDPETSDPAPSILPPGIANRLRAERAKPVAPRFVPPRSAGSLPPAARRPV